MSEIKLASEVEKIFKKYSDSDKKEKFVFSEGVVKDAKLQREYERERVKKVIESMAIYGREDCINRKELLKELGIEQEEKEK